MKGKHAELQKLFAHTNINIDVVLDAITDSIEHGYIDWGTYRDDVIKILNNPDSDDIFQIVIKGEQIFKPLASWVMMEKELIEYQKAKMTEEEYLDRFYRFTQLYNFLLLLKLH